MPSANRLQESAETGRQAGRQDGRQAGRQAGRPACRQNHPVFFLWQPIRGHDMDAALTMGGGGKKNFCAIVLHNPFLPRAWG